MFWILTFINRLRRCEIKLKELGGADPEKSCMYPLRDWVTCVEGFYLK